jgi:hypothetical protein
MWGSRTSPLGYGRGRARFRQPVFLQKATNPNLGFDILRRLARLIQRKRFIFANLSHATSDGSFPMRRSLTPTCGFYSPGEGTLHDDPPDHDAVEEMVFSGAAIICFNVTTKGESNSAAVEQPQFENALPETPAPLPLGPGPRSILGHLSLWLWANAGDTQSVARRLLAHVDCLRSPKIQKLGGCKRFRATNLDERAKRYPFLFGNS